MKRRLFLKSLWFKSVALPSAYFLSSGLKSATIDGLEFPADGNKLQGKGCGNTKHGLAKERFGVIARDFYDPYLELIRLLKEASEIEHSLMIQYLFAAFSLKPKYQALVGSPEPGSNGLLSIAIQEMQHLASVNKLLVALGSSPNLDQQDFPHEPDIYPFPLNLERLSRSSLARYAYVEAGQNSIPMNGLQNASNQLLCDELTTELGFNTKLSHVAGLYGVIVDHLETMAKEDTLQLDNSDKWISELKRIMAEGEREHFRFFSQLFLGNHPSIEDNTNPWNHDQDHPDYPSFFMPSNPTAYLGHNNQILSQDARALAWLSNLHYWMVLMMLDLHYRIDSELLNDFSQTHMLAPLQSIAGRLAEYGSGVPFDRLSVGYSPAPDHAGNLEFIRKLSQEADTLAHKMQSNLPSGYPLELHQTTSKIINLQLDALS